MPRVSHRRSALLRPLPRPRLLPLLAGLLLLAPLLAGCTESGDAPAPVEAPATPAWAPHPLAGTVEPAGLAAPAFRLAGAIARTGPVYGGGEPSVWAALDGTLYVAFPGCDAGAYLVDVPGQDTCQHGLVYRSADDGATWTRLNRAGDGRYEDGGAGPAANGDAEVAVDSAGTVYASNLGGGIQVHKSTDGGATWAYLGNATERREDSDRQWMAAAGPGHLIVTWMGSGEDLEGEDQERAVIVNTTFDGGATWTGALALGSDIGWLGPVAFAPDGRTAYIPFTQVEASGPSLLLAGTQAFSMRVARTLDGGRNWTVLDTGARWDSVASGGHWSGVHMAPALDVTGDGAVVVAYAVDRAAPTPGGALAAAGTELRALASLDGGATWTAPQVLPVPSPLGVEQRPGSPIMPWVVGGAGDRFAVTYLLGTSLTDSDYEGTVWDVRAMVVDGLRDGSLVASDGLVEAAVHQGAVCTRGGACLVTGSDRAILDFFESDVTPDGRLVVSYPADPLQGGKYIEIRVAVQDGGTLLLERPAQA